VRGTSLIAGCLLLVACGSQQDTAADVATQYAQLKATLDPDTVGQSIHTLETFKRGHAHERIVAQIDQDIGMLREQARDRFHLARELIRGNDTARAEKILHDLSTRLPDTEVGRMAKEFMAFDFYMIKANRLMNDRRLAEAEKTLRGLSAAKLSPAQAGQVERVLDTIHDASIASLENVCRQLLVALQAFHAQDGQYPAALSLNNLPNLDPTFESQIKESISSIEGYRATRDTFSFVAVGKDGTSRQRVTERGLE
jgi:hypothetical protein